MTNKTIEANKKLEKIMKIKKDLMTVFTEVEFQATKFHTAIFICDGVEVVADMTDSIGFANQAFAQFVMKTGAKSVASHTEKFWYFTEAYKLGLVATGKEYAKLTVAKLKAMVEGN